MHGKSFDTQIYVSVVIYFMNTSKGDTDEHTWFLKPLQQLQSVNFIWFYFL